VAEGVEKALSEGISFGNRRKKKQPDSKPELSQKPETENEQLLRQQRLQDKIETAKAINYSGMAVNGGSAWFVLFGVYGFISDPNSAVFLDIINDLFFIEITHEQILTFIEAWKTHLLSLMASSQAFLAWYQQMRNKMKQADNESFFKVVNDEIGKLL